MTFSEIISSRQFVLVDFYATWCEPCKWVEPILDEVTAHFAGKIVLHKVDVDKQTDVAQYYLIMSVPTLMLFKNGKEVWRFNGFDTAHELIKILEDIVK